MFQNDEKINNFLQKKEEFINAQIDDQEIHATKMQVLHLKDNSIPRGLVHLEEIFDQDDATRKPTMSPTEVGVEDLNLGTSAKPKMVQISKSLSLEMKVKYAVLMSQFLDVFA